MRDRRLCKSPRGNGTGHWSEMFTKVEIKVSPRLYPDQSTPCKPAMQVQSSSGPEPTGFLASISYSLWFPSRMPRVALTVQ
jgi:hypothetical protein